MTHPEPRGEHLTDYERAICYHTLPKLNNPLTFGLIVAYTVCLFEAGVVLLIGIFRNDQVWQVAGTVALAAIILFGVIVFFGRAFLADLRQRKALAAARGVPDHSDSFHDFDLPDPFAGHVLLKHEPVHREALFRCDEDKAALEFLIEHGPSGQWWLLKTPEGEEACRVRALEGPRPLAFNSGRPRLLGVYQGDREIATIRRPFSFNRQRVEIRHRDAALPPCTIENAGIYVDKALVGRFYELRGIFYLDVESRHYTPALAAYYATLT